MTMKKRLWEILLKIDHKVGFMLDDVELLIGLIVGGIIISMGIVMLTDHTGLADEQIKFFDNIGIIFFIGGGVILILDGIVLHIKTKTPKASSTRGTEV